MKFRQDFARALAMAWVRLQDIVLPDDVDSQRMSATPPATRD